MTGALTQLLDRRGPSGIYRVSARADAGRILSLAHDRGWAAFHLHGRSIVDKAGLLAQAASSFGFPAYFGHNWDAFEEMLVDPSWRPAPGYLLLYDDPVTLAQRDPAAWRTLLAILRTLTSTRQPQDAPWIVLLRTARRLVPDAPWL